MADLQNVPVLEGYVLMPDAAERLGVSRQALWFWLQEGLLVGARKIGKQPIYLIPAQLVDDLASKIKSGEDIRAELKAQKRADKQALTAVKE